jgi:hypothetical protein
MGNGALPHGPSYRAHPRLYQSWPEGMRRHVRSWRKLTYEGSGGVRVLTRTGHARPNFAVLHNTAQTAHDALC